MEAPSATVMSWNIEGLETNIYNLHHFISDVKPCLVFLSLFMGSYNYVLNSEDKHDLDTPLDRLSAKGAPWQLAMCWRGLWMTL